MTIPTVQDVTSQLVSMGIPKYDFHDKSSDDYPNTLHWLCINRWRVVVLSP